MNLFEVSVITTLHEYSNKTEHLGYKGKYGKHWHTRIETFIKKN